MVIAMINNRRNAFPVKERNKLSIMPLPFMQQVLQSFIYRGRSGIFDLCLKSKSAIVNHLLKKEVVIIPFLHWNTQHYGCFVLFSKTTTRSKQMVLWDYAKQTTPLNRCQSRILIASFLCDFFNIATTVMKDKFAYAEDKTVLAINSNNTYYDTNHVIFIRRRPVTFMHSQDEIGTSGGVLCHDLLQLASVDGILLREFYEHTGAPRDVQWGEVLLPVNDLATFVSNIAYYLRPRFSVCYIRKLSQTLDERDSFGERKWSSIKQNIVNGTQLFQYLLDKRGDYVVNDISADHLNEFLSPLLYAMARFDYEIGITGGIGSRESTSHPTFKYYTKVET
jgi:hypothetical protein